MRQDAEGWEIGDEKWESSFSNEAKKLNDFIKNGKIGSRLTLAIDSEPFSVYVPSYVPAMEPQERKWRDHGRATPLDAVHSFTVRPAALDI